MINYNFLAKSLEFFENKDFKRMETPWWVSSEIKNVTFNKECRFKFTDGKCLVGSGEQGFLHLMSKGILPAGSYCTLTPCFREDTNGIYYQKNFMKIELIETAFVNERMLDSIVKLCLENFKQLIPSELHYLLTIVKTSEGFDINFNNVEIGSYGIRKYEFLHWIYATGLAEPRFSKILDSLK